MTGVLPKTRLDPLVKLRERSEERALRDLARARSTLGRATERLDGLREEAKADDRGRGAAELWALEESAHVRRLQAVRAAEGDLAQAVKGERAARAGYATAHRGAEAARRVQEKKRTQIVEDREKRAQKALDELATLRFNARR